MHRGLSAGFSQAHIGEGKLGLLGLAAFDGLPGFCLLLLSLSLTLLLPVGFIVIISIHVISFPVLISLLLLPFLFLLPFLIVLRLQLLLLPLLQSLLILLSFGPLP